MKTQHIYAEDNVIPAILETRELETWSYRLIIPAGTTLTDIHAIIGQTPAASYVIKEPLAILLYRKESGCTHKCSCINCEEKS